MDSIKGKKLLVLGGSSYMIGPILQAKSMGVYTIVTDLHGIEKAPAKLVADEYWDISLMAYDQLVPKIKECKVDGILTGFTDAFLQAYQHLCELTGLPCYLTKELIGKTLSKSDFKNMCRNNGLPVVPEYSLETFSPSVIDKQNRVIIKPVDNSGSNGITICDDPNNFEELLNYSLSFSAKRQIIIEQYIELDSISVSYTIQDGVPSLSTINDDYLYKTPNAGAVNCGGRYPSKYIDFYVGKYDSLVKSMLINEGFKNGVLFMQAFTNGEVLYFFEMGYRLSGGRHYILTENQNNSSSLKQLINFALTGRMANYTIADRDNAYFKDVCYRFNLIGNPGRVAKIEGFDYLQNMDNIIHASLLKQEGDEVGLPGTTATQLLCAYAVVKDHSHFKRLLDDVYENVRFLDAEGKNLVIRIEH